MNSEELNANWQNVIAEIKRNQEVNPAEIDAIFGQIVPQAMSTGFLMATVSSPFLKKHVESRYLPLINKALTSLYGVEFVVVLEVDEEQLPNAPMTTAAVAAPAPAAPAPAIPSAADAGIGAAAPSQTPAPAFAAAQAQQAPAQSAMENQAMSRRAQLEELERNEEQFRQDLKTTGYNPLATLTFENFVVGDSNLMAYEMAAAVAENPGRDSLNPLFIYGRSGLGKTHLLRAIENRIHETRPQMRVVYADSADILNAYVEASTMRDLRKTGFIDFKARYEQADVLLIDDVQFFQGKQGTLDNVFQILNKLIDQGKQVVLSADRAPKNIDIDERYYSRFMKGGIFDIKPPEIETKLGIIMNFFKDICTMEDVDEGIITRDILEYIAEFSSSNIRELKSAVMKVVSHITVFKKGSITLEEVKTLLDGHFSGGPQRTITILEIQKEVASFYGVTVSELSGTKRSRNIAHARHVAMYLAQELSDATLSEIGKKFSRDHTTVMSGIRNIKKKAKEDREQREELEAIKKMIREVQNYGD